MIPALAGAAAAAVLVAALGGCTSSSPSSPPASTASGVGLPASSANSGQSVPEAPQSGATTSSSSPSTHSTTAIAPVRPLTCASLPPSLGRYHRGGSLPSGVPLPQAVPTLTCTGGRAVAVIWSSVSAARYRQEITQLGWTASSPAAVYTKPHAPRTILLASVHGKLVAVYRPH